MRALFSCSLAWLVGLLPTAALAAAKEASQPDRDPPIGAATYVLAHRFEPGEILRWQVVHQATVRTTIQGTSQTARTRSESVKVWEVTKVTPEEGIEVVHSVAYVKMTNELPNRAVVQYDSEKDAAPPPGFETVAKTVGVPLTVLWMTPQGKVLRREEKRHQPGNQADLPIAIPLPNGPVAVGHVWNEPHQLSVPGRQGALQQLKTRRRFELTGVQNGIATIAVDYQVLTPVRDPAIEAQLAQRLSHGTIQFDIEAGRIVSQQMDVDKRVLGFSGPTSSIHHVMRRTEHLLGSAQKMARAAQ